MQDESGRIGFQEDFHFLDVSMSDAIDEVLERTAWLNREIALYLTDGPASIEYCFCKNSLTNALLPIFIARELASDWPRSSLVKLFIFSDRPRCDMLLSYEGWEPAIEWFFQRCGNSFSLRQICHGATDPVTTKERRITRQPSVRSQATDIIKSIVEYWQPGQCLIGTGDPNEPTIIEELILPESWENE
jgi:hypothetical protein